MITLQGYTALDLLYDGTGTTFYRGYDNRDKRPVVIKLCNRGYAFPPDLDRTDGTGFNITLREITPEKRE